MCQYPWSISICLSADLCDLQLPLVVLESVEENTWIFTEADRLSASGCPVAKVELTQRAEMQTTGN